MGGIVGASEKSRTVLSHESVIHAICLQRFYRGDEGGLFSRRQAGLVLADTHVIFPPLRNR